MVINIKRFKSVGGTTLGKLFIDEIFFCYTLEDQIRPLAAKIWGRTAIPAGTYSVVNSYSNRFKQYMPELIAVPGFNGVRIHAGNSVDDTHGCILVGFGAERADNGYRLTNSRKAYSELLTRLKEVEKKEKIILRIENTSVLPSVSV